MACLHAPLGCRGPAREAGLSSSNRRPAPTRLPPSSAAGWPPLSLAPPNSSLPADARLGEDCGYFNIRQDIDNVMFWAFGSRKCTLTDYIINRACVGTEGDAAGRECAVRS